MAGQNPSKTRTSSLWWHSTPGVLQSQVRRQSQPLPHEVTPTVGIPQSAASTSSQSATSTSSQSDASTSSQSVPSISPPHLKTPIPPQQSTTPASPPSTVTPNPLQRSVYSDSSTLYSSPTDAYPSRALPLRGSTSTKDAQPHTDYIAPLSAPTPRSESHRPGRTKVSAFSGASGIKIKGSAKIITSGGSFFQGKVPEIEYPEHGEDEEVEVSSFKDVTKMTATGDSLDIITAGGNVISGVSGVSLPKRRARNADVHSFAGAKDVELETVEVVNVSDDVVLESLKLEWFVIDLALLSISANDFLAQIPVCWSPLT